MCGVTALMIGSTLLSAVGSVAQGNAQAASAEYNAQIAGQNAIYADARAKDALERGQLEEERVRREGTLVRKGQEARYGAAGIDLAYGSPLDAIISSSTQAELDALTVRANTNREAEDFEREAFSYRANADLSRMEGKNAKRAGFISAVGSVLSGGAGVYKYKQGLA
jgi:hypothetical protein